MRVFREDAQKRQKSYAYSDRNTATKYSSCPCTPCRRNCCTVSRGNSARPPDRVACCRSCSGVSRRCKTCRHVPVPDDRTSSRLWTPRHRRSSSNRSTIPTRPNRRRCAAVDRRWARIPDSGTTTKTQSVNGTRNISAISPVFGHQREKRGLDRDPVSYHVFSAVRSRGCRMQHRGADAVHDAP